MTNSVDFRVLNPKIVDSICLRHSMSRHFDFQNGRHRKPIGTVYHVFCTKRFIFMTNYVDCRVLNQKSVDPICLRQSMSRHFDFQNGRHRKPIETIFHVFCTKKFIFMTNSVDLRVLNPKIVDSICLSHILSLHFEFQNGRHRKTIGTIYPNMADTIV